MEDICTDFEQGPIRPPSEAASLLVRLTRNCPWNRCTFCPVYKGARFSIRPVDEIRDDIRAMGAAADQVKDISRRLGRGGEVDWEVLRTLHHEVGLGRPHLGIATWMFHGGRNVFLQDANSLVMKTPDMVEVLGFLKETFPRIERITTYARSKTIAKKSAEEIRALGEGGISRIHIGLETGHDPLLDLVRKGSTAAEHIEAGRRVKRSGISLSEYVILGLGGRQWWREHAIDTAKALNEIDPDFIRVRTLALVPGIPLYEAVERGEFELLDDEGVVAEERLLIENLDGISSRFVSDHILNLLEEVEGKLPDEKGALLAVIDRFLSLPEEERLNWRLGRRAGAYRSLDDMDDPATHARVEKGLDRLRAEDPDNVGEKIQSLMRNFI